MASGSGGVGRSTLAVTLGARLVRRGRSACLVDADWSGPSLGALLDVPEFGAGWGELDELQSRPTALHDDLHVVPGASPTTGDPTRADAARLARAVARLPHSEVLLDLPAGGQDAALDLWLGTDRPVLVAVPERLPLEATARFLGRVFARLARPFLSRRHGEVEADSLLQRGFVESGGRTGTWMRAVARLAEASTDELAAEIGARPLFLVLNRVRRADDIDVGHALVTAAGHGLGLDLRFRAALPWDDEAWIRARRPHGGLSAHPTDVLGRELDEFVQRMDDGVDVPSRGSINLELRELALLAGASGSGAVVERPSPPWR